MQSAKRGGNINIQETYKPLNENDNKLTRNKEAKPALQKNHGHIITAEDYSDVLDMINGYNL